MACAETGCFQCLRDALQTLAHTDIQPAMGRRSTGHVDAELLCPNGPRLVVRESGLFFVFLPTGALHGIISGNDSFHSFIRFTVACACAVSCFSSLDRAAVARSKQSNMHYASGSFDWRLPLATEKTNRERKEKAKEGTRDPRHGCAPTVPVGGWLLMILISFPFG